MGNYLCIKKMTCFSGSPSKISPWEFVLERKRSPVTKDGNFKRYSSCLAGGMVYPLNLKRLKLRHTQHLVSALNLSATTTRSDLKVIIDGKLAESSHDTASAQVVIAQSEEREQLLLRDMKGTIIVTHTLP